MLTSPVVSLEKELTKRKANEIESEWSYKYQNSTYLGKFQWNFDQGKWNLLQFFVLFLTKVGLVLFIPY